MKLREPAVASALADETLVSKIATGDLESLGILFDRYEPTVRRVLSYLTARSADVDDLVQVTFLQVIRAAPRYDPKYSVRSWLAGIAAIMARRHRRSLRRMAGWLRSWTTEVPQDVCKTPDQAFDSIETERRLLDVLAGISRKRREAFVLVAIEGTTGEEAAASLGIPLNTLWTRLHYARRELRARLIDEER
jgi:RNA polymerase sigma-70 factor (ECF subfamily)